MKVLLDTNIIIHREASSVIKTEIGTLFRWLDELGYEKYIHPLTIDEISRHKDPKIVKTFQAKINSYKTLKTIAPDTLEIRAIKDKDDRNVNDVNDSSILNELAAKRVDILITEDRNIHRKAKRIGIGLAVFTIDAFLEKANAENPQLATYKVLSVRQEYFGHIDVSNVFFDSFREDYLGFNNWFNKKSDETAYICKDDGENIVAFLYIKAEGVGENYSDISPTFIPKKRLKIGTFKVVFNGFKIGERFIKIIFDNAVKFNVDEIYVTVFDNDDNKLRLIKMLEDWGFSKHGTKSTKSTQELVLVRECSPNYAAHQTTPRLIYPFAHAKAKKWIVPIYPEYHTELFPDSILNTESPREFTENKPNRNSISKVYISRSINKNLSPGDIIVFYRTTSGGSAWYTSVTTTIGIVQSVEKNIQSEERFVDLCRRRSVFPDDELKKHWNYQKSNRPFVVNFLYLYSFPRRINRKTLVENAILGDNAPRGFEPLTDVQFDKLLGASSVDRRIIVDKA